ncbi:unnamed protein product [Strongylus vulgaris]|uniref:Lactate/malate dehydrogenase C-terminal domain-containing protein n=1 Tax=Strongylus vulgaris TaxID=40348 RepID=A0A3P7L9A6_STRVU|nr:unnamed protein product [Strongylus vulgaris]
MSATVKEVFEEIAPMASFAHGKVTVVGVGQVGMACAYSILQQNIANEISLVDVLMFLPTSHGKSLDCLKKEFSDLEQTLAPLEKNLNLLAVAVWSGVNVAGVNLSNVKPNIGAEGDDEHWEEDIHKKVVDSAYEIIKLKGYTSWAIGLSVAKIVQSIMTNSRNVFALSTNVKGFHGIKDDVYLSLPVVLGSNGVTHVVKQNLSASEVKQFHKSAESLLKVQNDLVI